MALKTQGTELYYLSAPAVMTKVTAATGVSGLGGSADPIEITDLDDLVYKKFMQGLEDAGSCTVPLNFDTANTVHRGLLALKNAGTTVKWVIGLSDGTAPPTATGSVVSYPTTRSYFDFDGFISSFPLDLGQNSKVDINMSIKVAAAITPHWKT